MAVAVQPAAPAPSAPRSKSERAAVTGSRGHRPGAAAGRRGRRRGLPDPALRRRDAGGGQAASPTARWTASTSWPRASTPSSRSSSTPARSARASSSAPRAWAGSTPSRPSRSPPACGCRWSRSSATGRWTTRAPSASSTTTRWRCATSAGCWPGSIPAQEALDLAVIAYRVAEDTRIIAAVRAGRRRRLPDPLAAPGEDPAA